MDAYIARFPQDVQKILKKVRQTIRKAAPDAQETISKKRALEHRESAMAKQQGPAMPKWRRAPDALIQQFERSH